MSNNRWKYGNYQFEVNPNSSSVSTEVVGDNMRTLSGALIAQPSFLKDEYSISTVFYQPRTRVKSQINLQNSALIDHYGGKIYAINRLDDRIDIYGPNLSIEGAVSLSAIAVKTYVGLSIAGSYIYIASSVDSTIVVNVLARDGTLSSSITSKALNGKSCGFTYLSSNYWSISSNGSINKIRPTDGVVTSTITMPFELYYRGLTNDGKYLIVGNNDEYTKFYHVDYSMGEIVNQVSNEDIKTSNDIAFDGNYIYSIGATSLLQIIDANTVECELYSFQKEVMTKSFVNMIDDMGVSKRVFASNVKAERRLGFENTYEVSMSIIKVDRG